MTDTTPRVRLFDRRALEERDYWVRQLARDVEPAAPPADVAPGAARAGVGEVRFGVEGAAYQALSRVTRGSAFLVHAAFCAALKVCLFRYRGLPGPAPIAVATPPRVGEGEAAAPNVVCTVDEIDGASSFRQVLGAVRQTLLDGYAHQGYPFDRLMGDLRADGGRRAAFESIVLETDGVTSGLPAGVQAQLSIRVQPGADAVQGRITFPAAGYRRETVEAFATHLVALLGALLADPAAPIGSVPMMGEAERRRLDALNDTSRPIPSASVHALFAEQAARTPDAVATVHNGEALTYAELDVRSGRLAAWLAARGIGREARVGVYLERGAPMIAAFLAILRAGAAYLPLDPAAPPARIRDILGDAGATLVLTQADRAAQLPEGVESVALGDEFFDALPVDAVSLDADADGLAYVIYTSGSTGRPKGVAIPHRGVVRLVREADYVPFGPGERIAQLSSAAFDAATFEIWGALLNGGSVVVIDRDVSLSPQALAEELRHQGVTALFLTTALFNRVAREKPDAFASLKHLLFGGEAVDPDAVGRVLEAGAPERLLHVYGPTESTTFASWHLVDEVDAATVPIGGPVANTTLHVLDAQMQPVPTGVPGELYVGGQGLARGYLGRAGLTAEKFVPHPFGGPNERLYRTGDRVRRDGTGAIEFLGRFDFQVKVRGFRIEPGEIEAALLREPGVREAIVVVREDDGEKRLVGYVVADRVSGAELKAALGERLPSYMVPSAIVALPALPLNANGKVDRAALPEPGPEAAAYVAPRTPTEEILAGVYAAVLRLPRVGVDDSFFELGGHSLLVMQVIARVRQLFGVEVPMRAAFEAPTVAGLAVRVDELLRGGAQGGPPPLRRVEHDGPRPLSFAQQRLWLVDRLEPGSAAYNVPAAVRLRGPLDADALEQAFAELGRRHETLRTRFPAVDGEPVQVVEPPAPVPLVRVDLGALPPEPREAEARRMAADEALRPFDLSAGPLVRAALLRLAGDDHVLLLTLHHIVTDGWSMEVLVREVSALYDAHRRGEPSPLPPLPVQYADFAAWQRAWLSGDTLQRQIDWWRERLAGAPPLLEIPTDRPRQPRPDPRAGRVYFRLSAEASDGLRQAGHREGATLFMVLMAAWQALLARYAGQDDVVVGTPIAGRMRMELEGLIGFFVNMLPVRTDVSGDPAFRELLGRVRESTLGAYQHQDLPFERLVEEVAAERTLAHAPLFQVSFAFQRAGADAGAGLGEVAIDEFGRGTGIAKFDLDLTVRDAGGALLGVVAYRSSLFDDATIQRMAGHLSRLLEAVAADPGRRLSAIPLLDAAERARVLDEWNATGAEYPIAPVHELFALQAARTPGAAAVIFGGETLTYAGLDRAANRLANALRRRGVGPEVRVGLCLERGPGQVVAVMGILKAGGAYVPLDPASPPDRLSLIVADAGAPVVVTQASLAAKVAPSGAAALSLDGDAAEIAAESDAAPRTGVTADNLAYVIYTSGSTGRPKGVLVPHRGVANLAGALRDAVYAPRGAAAPPRVSLNGPLSFDTSVKQWVQLLSGATLCPIPEEVRYDGAALGAYLREHAVDVFDCTPAQLRALLQADGSLSGPGAGPSDVLVAGEAIDEAAWRQLGAVDGRRFHNLYGPTECTVDAALCRIGGSRATPVIGAPVANARAYVLGAAGQPAPLGVPGELYVGGAGVARGYLGRPALTAEKFVPDPFGPVPGARLYRTGDRARWRAEGELEFLGRVDEQVKIRGFRIEPGEVESVLRGLPGVRDVAVVAREEQPGDLRLVAYVAGEAAPAALREAAGARLPGYMVPAAFVALDALPLTPNGKVDRRALPAPRWGDDGGYTAPESPIEELLCQMWAELLDWRTGEGRRPIGTGDDFFVLGGHSILAMRLTARVRQALGVDLPLRAVFEAPTVAALARTVEACLLGTLSDTELLAQLLALDEPAAS